MTPLKHSHRPSMILINHKRDDSVGSNLSVSSQESGTTTFSGSSQSKNRSIKTATSSRLHFKASSGSRLWKICVSVLLAFSVVTHVLFARLHVVYDVLPSFDRSADSPMNLWLLEDGVQSTDSSSTLAQRNFEFNYTEPSRHAIFYNVYVPADQEGQANALRIVREQVDQIKQSYAASWEASQGSLILYYVTLGAANILTPRLMQQYCGPIRCISVDYFPEGSEVVSLAHLHKFCSSPGHDESRVTYLHNKGSFHYNQVNENWRPILTEATLSKMCLQESECNLCGLQFYTIWAPFIPGNMFTAKCDYVKKLIPPLDFAGRMEEAIGEVVLLRLTKQIQTRLLPDRKDFFGLERYSDEHWIASHPDVVPCDCDSLGQMWRYHVDRVALSNLSWSMAPHIEGSPAYSKAGTYTRISERQEFSLREYYFLAGNLIKWFSLYGKAPGPNSWAWTWFPDGEVWKQAVKEYGNKAVHQVTKQNVSLWVIPEEPASPELPNDRVLAPQVRHVDRNNSTFSSVVFFDMAIDNGAGEEAASEELQGIEEQLDVISKVKTISKVFYTTMGHVTLNQSNMCVDERRLDCVHIKHIEEVYAGETLRHIHEYCRYNPTKRIVYLRNQLPGRLKDPKRRMRLVKHLTMAVTSELCSKALDDSNQCNVCGMRFFTMNTLQMLGNMWSSDCTYINRLLVPEDFVRSMKKYIAKVLIQKIWTRINFGIAEETPDSIGLAGYAMEHWVGSHPSLLPCDVTNETVAYWIQKVRSPSKLKLYIGAHSREKPFVASNTALENQVLSSERLRIREFHYLAGNLLKWLTLYGSVPHPASWVWSHFPDGNIWLNGVMKHGHKVVEEITSQFELSEQEIHDAWAKQAADEAQAAHEARLAEAAERHAAQLAEAARFREATRQAQLLEVATDRVAATAEASMRQAAENVLKMLPGQLGNDMQLQS